MLRLQSRWILNAAVASNIFSRQYSRYFLTTQQCRSFPKPPPNPTFSPYPFIQTSSWDPDASITSDPVSLRSFGCLKRALSGCHACRPKILLLSLGTISSMSVFPAPLFLLLAYNPAPAIPRRQIGLTPFPRSAKRIIPKCSVRLREIGLESVPGVKYYPTWSVMSPLNRTMGGKERLIFKGEKEQVTFLRLTLIPHP